MTMERPVRIERVVCRLVPWRGMAMADLVADEMEYGVMDSLLTKIEHP